MVFKPEEWRSSKQITSFFSRLSSLQKRNEPLSQLEEINEDDMIAFQHEDEQESLHEVIQKELDRPSHPIIVLEIDVCEKVNSKKLNTLKLVQLRSICNELDLDAIGHQSRKSTFITPIEKYVEACSCQD